MGIESTHKASRIVGICGEPFESLVVDSRKYPGGILVGTTMEAQERTAKVTQVQDQFIMEWGRMSSSWGINRTMAQIHALLFITGRAHSMDEIIQRLHISRGNASMNLRDLEDWGIVYRFRNRGDRKDLYTSDSDPVRMFARVARERKRRELDPTYKALQEIQATVGGDESGEDADVLRQRLNGLIQVFEIVNTLYDQVLKTDEAFEQTMRLFGRKD